MKKESLINKKILKKELFCNKCDKITINVASYCTKCGNKVKK